MTVYLCLSAPKFPVFNRWLRLVLTSALDEMTETLDPPPLPVCFMLDELATLGHVQPIENAIGLAAGYGVQLICVFQDVAQMRDLYKGRWASFIGNAGVRALFSLDDYDTAKYWSDFVGGRIVATHSQQQDNYGLSQGQNVGETMRPLLSPEEIMLQFGHGRMLVLPQGKRPVVTERFAYWDDPALNGLWDDPRKPGKRGPMPPPPHPLGTAPPPRWAASANGRAAPKSAATATARLRRHLNRKRPRTTASPCGSGGKNDGRRRAHGFRAVSQRDSRCERPDQPVGRNRPSVRRPRRAHTEGFAPRKAGRAARGRPLRGR